jgi:hypothetical protein
MNPLNPEAGDTPAPSDPLELAVARAAAAVVWRAVPYFAFRYGERGRRFGASDAAWLVTLAGLPRDARLAQIDWLAGLLAARGMPSWLLEIQLAATARAATRRSWAGAGALADAAVHLSSRRRAVLPEPAFLEAGRLFARLAGLAGGSRLATGAGRLIAAAHADVALGICASPAPVVGWFMDPAIFPAAWRAAVEQTAELAAAAIVR